MDEIELPADAVPYERRRFAERAYRVRFARMERLLHHAISGRACVLDLGCGTGRLARTLEAQRVIGLDRSRSMATVARSRGLEVVLGDGNALPFRDAAFDGIVIADSVLAQLTWERALPELARTLQSGGVLVTHLKAARVWSPRAPLSLQPVDGASEDTRPERLLTLAARVGMQLRTLELWRWLRVAPYLLAMPKRVGWPLWNQGVFVFLREARARAAAG